MMLLDHLRAAGALAAWRILAGDMLAAGDGGTPPFRPECPLRAPESHVDGFSRAGGCHAYTPGSSTTKKRGAAPMPICPGPCNTHYRHAYRAYQEQMRAHEQALITWDGTPDTAPIPPEPPTIRPWLGDPIWCRRCTTTLRQELAELDDLAALYAARTDGHREIHLGPRVSGTPTQASPSPTVEDLDELEAWLRDWRAAYSGMDTPARQGYMATAITTNVAWLLARAEMILARPEFGADFGREIHEWHTRLTIASRSSTRVDRKPLRCPACHMLRLEHRDGDDAVRCANPDCGFELGLGEYEALVEQAINQAS